MHLVVVGGGAVAKSAVGGVTNLCMHRRGVQEPSGGHFCDCESETMRTDSTTKATVNIAGKKRVNEADQLLGVFRRRVWRINTQELEIRDVYNR